MTLSWQTIAAVGCGGFLGAIARVYLNATVTKLLPHEFPFGILTVNVLGSFLIGILFAIFIHYNVNESLKAFLTAGFLGALTTYSTFAIESFFLLETSFFLGVSNMALNVFGTVLAAGGGYKLLFYFIR